MSLRILFADKGVASSDMLVPALERKGHEVAIVRTLNQALARFASFRPDLLVVDVGSFGRSGYRVADAIQPESSSVPRILLVDRGALGMGGQGDEVIVKPCTARSLLYRVGKIAKSMTVHELRAGPLRLEPDTRRLVRSDEAHVLRPKEAALLAFFMRNAGRVLTRQEIIRAVWETDYFRDTRTLSVHVRWLRQRIELDPHRPQLLRTVRGIGYRFDANEPPAQPQPAP